MASFFFFGGGGGGGAGKNFFFASFPFFSGFLPVGKGKFFFFGGGGGGGGTGENLVLTLFPFDQRILRVGNGEFLSRFDASLGISNTISKTREVNDKTRESIETALKSRDFG